VHASTTAVGRAVLVFRLLYSPVHGRLDETPARLRDEAQPSMNPGEHPRTQLRPTPTDLESVRPAEAVQQRSAAINASTTDCQPLPEAE